MLLALAFSETCWEAPVSASATNMECRDVLERQRNFVSEYVFQPLLLEVPWHKKEISQIFGWIRDDACRPRKAVFSAIVLARTRQPAQEELGLKQQGWLRTLRRLAVLVLLWGWLIYIIIQAVSCWWCPCALHARLSSSIQVLVWMAWLRLGISKTQCCLDKPSPKVRQVLATSAL